VHPDQHRIVVDHRLVDVFEFEDIRAPYLEWTIAFTWILLSRRGFGGEEPSGGSVLVAPKPRLS
jgi:hypothetical protein